MPEPAIRAVAVVFLAMFALAVAADASFAAGAGERVGENVGDLLGGWAKELYAGIVAVVSLVFLLNRKFTELGVFMLAAILVGGFVLAPGAVAGVVKDVWGTITATVTP